MAGQNLGMNIINVVRLNSEKENDFLGILCLLIYSPNTLWRWTLPLQWIASDLFRYNHWLQYARHSSSTEQKRSKNEEGKGCCNVPRKTCLSEPKDTAVLNSSSPGVSKTSLLSASAVDTIPHRSHARHTLRHASQYTPR